MFWMYAAFVLGFLSFNMHVLPHRLLAIHGSVRHFIPPQHHSLPVHLHTVNGGIRTSLFGMSVTGGGGGGGGSYVRSV